MQQYEVQGEEPEPIHRPEYLSGVLRALGNPRRLRILRLLSKQELSATRINDHLPQLSQSALSQHLAKLREEGLVRTRRQSQTVMYSMAMPARLILQALDRIYADTEPGSECDEPALDGDPWSAAGW